MNPHDLPVTGRIQTASEPTRVGQVQVTPGAVRFHDGSGVRTLAAVDTVPQSNLLTNGGFEVWQRGTGPFTAAGAYTADRWQLLLGSGAALTVTRESVEIDVGSQYSAKLAYTHSAVSRLRQSLENWPELRGRTVALSVRVKTATPNAVRLGIPDGIGETRSTYHSGNNAWQTLTATHTIAANASGVFVDVRLEASCTAYVDKAMLIVGAWPVEYAPLHPADDLSRCQRYYQVMTATTRFIATVAGQNGSSAIAFATTPAVIPTLTLSGGTIGNQAVGFPTFADISTRGARHEIKAAAAGDCFVLAQAVTVEANP